MQKAPWKSLLRCFDTSSKAFPICKRGQVVGSTIRVARSLTRRSFPGREEAPRWRYCGEHLTATASPQFESPGPQDAMTNGLYTLCASAARDGPKLRMAKMMKVRPKGTFGEHDSASHYEYMITMVRRIVGMVCNSQTPCNRRWRIPELQFPSESHFVPPSFTFEPASS